jgi:hypothetical protein
VILYREAHTPRSAALKNSETLPKPPREACPLCASSLEAQGPPDTAPNTGGTHPSSRDSAAITCASSLEAHRPRSAALNNSETLPKPPRGASPLCASSLEERGQKRGRPEGDAWILVFYGACSGGQLTSLSEPFIRQELARHRYLHSIPFGIGLPLYLHAEVDRAPWRSIPTMCGY